MVLMGYFNTFDVDYNFQLNAAVAGVLGRNDSPLI